MFGNSGQTCVYRDLRQWLDQPFTEPPEPERFQMEFAF